MRILHVYKEFHPQGSGVARHIDGILRALAMQGDRGAVFAPDVASDLPGAPYTIVSGGRGALHQAIREADIVHVHGARTPIAVEAAWLAGRSGQPVFYTPHCYYDSSVYWKRLLKALWDRTAERWLLKAAWATLLLDPVWAEDVARRGGRPARTVYLPNCVLRDSLDARRRPRTPRASDEGSPMLVSVGRLDPVKRLSDAIELLAAPGLERAVLHLVGGGPDATRLETVARHLGVSQRLRLHGRLPDADVAELMARADVFLLPSAQEGGPTALLEALWLGVPVIAAQSLGTDAMARSLGWSGLVPVGAPAIMAAAVLDPPPVTREVLEAIARVFTWEARIDELRTLYRAALDS